VIVTSQGRQGCGGNAVNIVEVTYATPEPDITEKPAAENENAAGEAPAEASGETASSMDMKKIGYIALGAFALIALGLIATLLMRKRRKKQ
jgi:hypothetical protein